MKAPLTWFKNSENLPLMISVIGFYSSLVYFTNDDNIWKIVGHSGLIRGWVELVIESMKVWPKFNSTFSPTYDYHRLQNYQITWFVKLFYWVNDTAQCDKVNFSGQICYSFGVIISCFVLSMRSFSCCWISIWTTLNFWLRWQENPGIILKYLQHNRSWVNTRSLEVTGLLLI